MADRGESELEFLCIITISVPFPTYRLASSALSALQVDAEISPLVQRSFALTVPGNCGTIYTSHDHDVDGSGGPMQSAGSITNGDTNEVMKTVLHTEYKATTNRMLRVAVNGFMESLGVVLEVMEQLDGDVLSGEH